MFDPATIATAFTFPSVAFFQNSGLGNVTIPIIPSDSAADTFALTASTADGTVVVSDKGKALKVFSVQSGYNTNVASRKRAAAGGDVTKPDASKARDIDISLGDPSDSTSELLDSLDALPSVATSALDAYLDGLTEQDAKILTSMLGIESTSELASWPIKPVLERAERKDPYGNSYSPPQYWPRKLKQTIRTDAQGVWDVALYQAKKDAPPPAPSAPTAAAAPAPVSDGTVVVSGVGAKGAHTSAAAAARARAAPNPNPKVPNGNVGSELMKATELHVAVRIVGIVLQSDKKTAYIRTELVQGRIASTISANTRKTAGVVACLVW